MDYAVLNIACADRQKAEILTAELADYPFESFEAQDGVLKAYIPAAELDDCKSLADDVLARYGVEGRYELIRSQNWNALWESDFEPVEVDGRLVIRAPFHAPAPEGCMEVVVLPRMSFGTGHHATTWLMTRAVLDMDMTGLRGLDMGSGTGVLAIVAAKCGAAHVDAVDIDDWADASCRENIAANGVADRIEPMLGGVERIAGRRYDFILANINRNVLAACMSPFGEMLVSGGDLLMSGFLKQDVPAVVEAAGAHGMHLAATAERDGWMMVHVRKG